jgi:hypothetical protein
VPAKINAASVPRSERILGRANCLPTDLVGDCVRISSDKVGNKYQVQKVDITAGYPAVGIVVKKYSISDCIVQFHGPLMDVYSSLSAGFSYVVGTDSRPAKIGDANYPVPGGTTFFQQIGVATSFSELLVIPLNASLGGVGGVVRYYQQTLNATVDPRVFTTSINFKHESVNSEVLSYNGQRLYEGVGNDYVVSESGGVGTGYDTITLEFTPRSGSFFLIDLTPDV